eukprot:SM000175S03309  [mRNA]  locus=s175:188215:190989:+ [translate_table: standard]
MAGEAHSRRPLRRLQTKFVPKIPARRAVKKPPHASAIASESDAREVGAAASESQRQRKEDGEGWPGRRLLQGPKAPPPQRVAFGFSAEAAAGTAKTSQPRGAAVVDQASRDGAKTGGGGGGAGRRGGTLGADSKDRLLSFQEGPEELFEPEKGKVKRCDMEPMDYTKYYPITLPLRPPHVGASDKLDLAEFGVVAPDAFDEDAMPAAQELGLWVIAAVLSLCIAAAAAALRARANGILKLRVALSLQDKSEQERLLFFQLPVALPLAQPAASEGDGSEAGEGAQPHGLLDLAALPRGCMGKLLVYESGAVKLKLGSVLLDALPGATCVFHQELAAIDTVSRECFFLGDVSQRVVLTPDVESLLANV